MATDTQTEWRIAETGDRKLQLLNAFDWSDR